jgi:hypothetical protein
VLWVLPLQQFVYRQLMYLVVIHSVTTALLGSRLKWHSMKRTGTADPYLLDAPPPPPEEARRSLQGSRP